MRDIERSNEIKEAKATYKLSKENKYNHEQQRVSFVRRIMLAEIPNIDLKVSLLR